MQNSKPQITIIVPDKKAKYNYEQLEKLFLMRGIKSKTILPKQLVRWSNFDLFITIGDSSKFKAYTSQYEYKGLSIGFFQSSAWIYYEPSGSLFTKEELESFLSEYKQLIGDFGEKFKSLSEAEINGHFWNKLRRVVLNKYNPFLWYEALFNPMFKVMREESESYFQNVLRIGLKSEELREVPQEHLYRFAVLKFVRDYLDEFMKENNFTKDNVTENDVEPNNVGEASDSEAVKKTGD